MSLVLMDSKLDTLSLPVLRPSIHAPEAELGGQSDPPYRVGCLVDRYFEWVGTFESSMFFVSRAWRYFAHSTKRIPPPHNQER